MTAPCHRCSPRISATTPTRPMRTSRLPGLLALLLALSACAGSRCHHPGLDPDRRAARRRDVLAGSRPRRAIRAPRRTRAPTRRESPESGTTYTVQPGDSLSSIARAYRDDAPAAPGLECGPLPVARDEPGHHRARMGPDRQRRPGRHPAPGADRAAGHAAPPDPAARRTSGWRPDRPRPSARSPTPVRASRSRSTWVAAWIRRSTS